MDASISDIVNEALRRFRILYEIEDDILIVTVVKIADRKEVYRRDGG